MKTSRPIANFENINGLVLKSSLWGVFGQHVKPFRIFLLVAILGLLLSGVAFLTQNTAMLPAGFILISSAGPLAFMAYINKKTQCLNSLVPVMIMSTFLVGGAVSLMIGGSLDTVIQKLDPAYIALVKKAAETSSGSEKTVDQKVLEAPQGICSKAKSKLESTKQVDTTTIKKSILLVGFFEEGAKLVFPLLLLLLVPLARRNVSIGLALGSLTALGFAVLESMYYGLADLPAFSDLGFMTLHCSDTLLNVITKVNFVLLFRDLTTPFGHLAWSGTAAIIIWHLVKSDKTTLAKVSGSVGIYLVVSVLHSLNDFFILNVGNVNYPVLMPSGLVAVIVVSFALFIWTLPLAVFEGKPAIVQVWDAVNKE